jgi:hypothetical protein
MKRDWQDPRHQEVQNFLNKNWKNRRCASCNRLPEWETDFEPYVVTQYTVAGPATKAVAVVHLMCNLCGHIELFGAKKVGALAGLPSKTGGDIALQTSYDNDRQGTDANGSPVES